MRKQNQLRGSTVLSSLHFSIPRMFNYIPTLFPKEFKAPVLCALFAVALGGQAVASPIGIQGHEVQRGFAMVMQPVSEL